ncbi:dynactin 1, partial [Lecanoromycetidae sp. Uapishka_2]
MNGSARPSSQTSASSLSRGPSNRLSMRPRTKERIESMSGESQQGESSGVESLAEDSELEALSPSLSEPQDDTPRKAPSIMSRSSALSPTASSDKPVSSRGRSPTAMSQRPTPAGTAAHREVEDLKTKLRLMEKRRMEDREKLKALEKVQADRDRFEGIIQKLQLKFQPQQQEIADLKKQLKDEEARNQAIEALQAENESANEMATLDREMAEETAESLKVELEALRQKAEELELEVEVLREENQELGQEMSPEEKTSQGWLQTERTNERLREALVRLRDVTQEQEANLKDQVMELEQDVQQLAKLKEEYHQTQEKLSQADVTVEELRQQLDTALGAEELIEELTEKNMSLNEKMEELKVTIEDLESLKELNDELEINHTETEKQLQDEIDYNEALLADEARKSAIQDGTIQDLEYTVARFRDLAKNMQSDLEDMRTSQQISETEASELSHRSRAMMDLNMRLQVSASKAQVKAIDLELGKMQAQESLEHLEIAQLFLPESFKSERDSVQALLRFRRIRFKANVMHHFIKERMQDPRSPGQEDDVFAFCDVLDKLVWVSSTCDRFINSIRSCNLEDFRRIGGASYEMEPVERVLNTWIDGLKKDDLKGEQCAIELQRSIALMEHLAEVHIREDLERYADDVHMRALLMQSYLENSATALSHIKSLAESNIPPPSDENKEEDADFDEYLRKIDSLVTQTRSAKIISSKSLRHLEDLRSRSFTLEPSTLHTVEISQSATSDLASTIRSAGTSILKVLNEEGRSEPVKYEELELLAHTSFSALASKLHTTTNSLQTFYNLTSSLAQTVEFPSPPPPPPWKILAQNMRTATADMVARETELGRLKDEMSEKNTTLAMKEKLAEEMSVKVEVLEKRVGESGGRREKVRELEAIGEAAKSKEKDLLSKLTQLQNELRSLEVERENWKRAPQLAPTTPQLGQPRDGATTSETSLRQIAALKAEIKALQSSVRFLRCAAHAQTLSAATSFLSVPIAPKEPVVPVIQTEAKDVLKEMLSLVSQSENHIVKLQPRDREDRLRWQPVKETSTWKAHKLREEWEEWREWRDEVARKAIHNKREEARKKDIRSRDVLKERTLASVQMNLPGKVFGQQLKIVKPGKWEEFEGTLGLNAT